MSSTNKLNKKLVVFLVRSYYPNIGGVEKHVYELSKILVANGYKITIIAESTKEEILDKKYVLNGVTVLKIPIGDDNWFKKFRIWKWIWDNRELFLQADVIHCHDVFFWYLPLALVHPLKPVYTTFHGYESYPIKLKAIIYRKIFEHMSNKTICVGAFMKKWYHASPNEIIYGGVNLPTTHSKPKRNTAIFIGRLDEHTGIDVYVKAVSIIRKKIPDFTLTVYGDGPLMDTVKREGIIFKGYDANADKEIQKYEFAFVSRYLAILEAMAAKRLVIAVYDNPVKKDYMSMTPYKDQIIRVNSANAIEEAVLDAKNNPNTTKQKIDDAYSWVKEQSWENIAESYVTLWA